MSETNHNDWLAEETEGQLAVDVYQDEHSIYILAPIAGVSASDIDISITDEVLTIRGSRHPGHDNTAEKHFTKECYWGAFSRSYVLPIAVNADQSKATMKDGLLRVEIPKDEKVKTKVIKINDELPAKK
ncbi:MAG: Hsp20/alpha crystallin family protein [bacterium]|nr:Hsp20/alpha crystallin family protein [bacterium]